MPTLDQHACYTQTGQPPITLRHIRLNLEPLLDQFTGDRSTQLEQLLHHVRSSPFLPMLAEQVEAQTTDRPDQMRLLTGGNL